MNEHCIRISRPRCSGQVEGVTYGSTMVGAVIDEVVENFLSAHRTLLAVNEDEADLLPQVFGRQ